MTQDDISKYIKRITYICHIFYGSGVFSQANPQKLSSTLQHGPSARPEFHPCNRRSPTTRRWLGGKISSFSSFLSRCHLWKYAEITGYCQEYTWHIMFTCLNLWYFWADVPLMLQASFNMGPFPSREPSELTLKPLVLVAMASSRGTPVQKGRRLVKLPRMQLDEWNESKEYVREWFEMVNFFCNLLKS